MRKTKRLLLIAVCCIVSFLTPAFADNEKPIKASQLPTKATSVSRPAKNMIYKIPTLPNRSKLASLANTFKPLGPNAIPAKISPTMCGMRARLSSGAHKIISNNLKITFILLHLFRRKPWHIYKI